MKRTKTITRTLDVTKGVAKVYKAGNDVLICRPFAVFGESDPTKIVKEIVVAPDERVLEVQIESTIQQTYAMPIEQFIRTAQLVNNDDTEEEPKAANTESEE